MIRCRTTGDFKKTMGFLNRVRKLDLVSLLQKYGEEGVSALREATPKDTGRTADSWDYEIIKNGESVSIFWTNSNVNNGVQIAVILNYGHGTGNGGYVQGRQYIAPAIEPIFDEIANKAWKEVTKN